MEGIYSRATHTALASMEPRTAHVPVQQIAVTLESGNVHTMWLETIDPLLPTRPLFFGCHNWRAKRACMFMSFEIRDTYIYAPEILKWLCKTRGTQYASIHGMCAHANY